MAILDQRFVTKPRDEWIQMLKGEGCIFTPIQTPLEVSNDIQAIVNNYFINVEHPERGRTKMVGFPWDFSETPASWRREAPAFGQHSEEILSELGHDNGDIGDLKEEGVIQ